jgi:hypothetical protein
MHLKSHDVAAEELGVTTGYAENFLGVDPRDTKGCDEFSRTAAADLIESGADPKDVWLVQCRILNPGFVWVNLGNGWNREKYQYHQIVVYNGIAIDNIWGVIAIEDLTYEFTRMQNLADKQWVPYSPTP